MITPSLIGFTFLKIGMSCKLKFAYLPDGMVRPSPRTNFGNGINLASIFSLFSCILIPKFGKTKSATFLFNSSTKLSIYILRISDPIFDASEIILFLDSSKSSGIPVIRQSSGIK